MLKGKEREFGGEREGLGKYFCCPSKKKGLDEESSGYGCWLSLGSPSPEKIKTFESTRCDSGQNWLGNSSVYTKVNGSSDGEPQDADYTNSPSLSYELESLILGRIPRSEYWKLSFVNKRYLNLLKAGELFKIRGEMGIKEPSVFMLATGENSWWEFDREFKSRRNLPIIPTDFCFSSGDKESFCAGNHLLVSGREVDGLVIWRYELVMNRWYKGPSMIQPRCLFASATSGTDAFVAGGIGINGEVYDIAEKYDSETRSWELLPRMKQKRKLCSGCYIDNKFYVIGGRNENGALTCGEFFDEAKNTWVVIPDMLRDDPVLTSRSPPLVAVANNELYSLEASSNRLKVYMKRTNSWKPLGFVPVRADSNGGWGVAFKSLGDELLVIGASSVSSSSSCNSIAIYTCSPHPDAEELQWRRHDSGKNQRSHFILNCSVMIA